MKEHPGFWQSTLQQLQSMTTPEMFKSWLLPLEVLQLDEDVITLKVPTQFFITFLKSNFELKIANALAMTTGKNYRIGYSVAGNDAPSPVLPLNAPSPPP